MQRARPSRLLSKNQVRILVAANRLTTQNEYEEILYGYLSGSIRYKSEKGHIHCPCRNEKPYQKPLINQKRSDFPGETKKG